MTSMVRSRTPDSRAESPFEFVHCDLAGPVTPIAIPIVNCDV